MKALFSSVDRVDLLVRYRPISPWSDSIPARPMAGCCAAIPARSPYARIAPTRMETVTQEGLEGDASHGAGDARRARSEERRRTVAQEQAQDTEATIAALLAEDRTFPPPPEFAAR